MDDLKVFTGNANRPLAENICHHLQIPLGDAAVGRFSDGEISVEFRENVRGKDVYVIQPTSIPCNEHLLELCIMLDALKRASARCVTAVVTYYAYARQDRKTAPRTPISAKLVADLITTAGATGAAGPSARPCSTGCCPRHDSPGVFELPAGAPFSHSMNGWNSFAPGFASALPA